MKYIRSLVLIPLAASAAFFVPAARADNPGFLFQGGARSDSKFHAPGTSLDNQSVLQWAQAIEATLATANAAIPKSGNMDTSGNLIAPVNSPLVKIGSGAGYGAYFINPSPQNGASPNIHVDFSAFWNELTLWSNAPGSNLLTLWNKSPTGFTALAFRGFDQDLNSQFEHFAIGYFPGLNIGGLKGYSGKEVSSYDMANDGHERASLYVDQQTGAHFDGIGIDITGIIPSGAMNTIICPGGCSFPTGINGDVVESQTVYGLFPKKTVIVSGEGTSTLTMSAPANFYSPDQTNGQPLVTGSSAYTQADKKLEVPMGNDDDFRYSDLHDNNFFNSPIPFFSKDYRKGKVGMWNPVPQAALDVNDHISAGTAGSGITPSAIAIRAACNIGALNACIIGGSGSASQVASSIYDATSKKSVQTLGTGTVIRTVANGVNVQDVNLTTGDTQTYHHPVNAQAAAYSLQTSDCGTTISVTGTTVITNGWGLPAGCRITISNMGTGTVTVVPGQSLTLGWYDTQAETGPYTLPGQYSSAVLEAKNSYVSTIERGQ
ncbi:MAG: hypothetical protein ABF979_16550 [Gluconobacter sp.]|uniref:hypothetical protein n=1 Tax=Gluconobacter sp. TaxID=1876758 RepID=UPI0039EC191C